MANKLAPSLMKQYQLSSNGFFRSSSSMAATQMTANESIQNSISAYSIQ